MNRSFLWLVLCLPLAASGLERSGSAQILVSQNYVNTHNAGQRVDLLLAEAQPRFTYALNGGRTQLSADYGLRAQWRVPGAETVFHQYRLDGRRDLLARRLTLTAGGSRSQQILSPASGLVSDYRVGGAPLSDVDQLQAGLLWRSRLTRWARLGAEADWSESRFGSDSSQKRSWGARLQQGSAFSRLLWSLEGGEIVTETRGLRLTQRQLAANGGLRLNRRLSLSAGMEALRYDRPSAALPASAGGGRIYHAGLRYRANRRAGLVVDMQRGYLGRAITGRLDYRHRRLALQIGADRGLVNGLSTLPGGPGVRPSAPPDTLDLPLVGGGGGAAGSSPVPAQPQVRPVATENALFLRRGLDLSFDYRGRRLSQRLYASRTDYRSEADGSTRLYESWGLAPGWRLGPRTQLQASLGGSRYAASAQATTRLTQASLGLSHQAGPRTRISLDGAYYRQAGGVARDDLRVTLNLDYRWWP